VWRNVVELPERFEIVAWILEVGGRRAGAVKRSEMDTKQCLATDHLTHWSANHRGGLMDYLDHCFFLPWDRRIHAFVVNLWEPGSLAIQTHALN